MPYRVVKINPLDLDSRKAVGVRLPFESPSVFTSTYQTLEAYKSNILNYLSTAKGDRYFNPFFGNKLLNSLFEHYTDAGKKALEKQLAVELSYYFPRLNIDRIDLQSTEENNEFQLHLEFSLKDSDLRDELVVGFG